MKNKSSEYKYIPFRTPRLSNRAWPWVVVQEFETFFTIQRWHRDNEQVWAHSLDDANAMAAKLNLDDYGLIVGEKTC